MGIPDEQLVVVATRGQLFIVERPLQPAHLTNQKRTQRPVRTGNIQNEGQSEREHAKQGPITAKTCKTWASQDEDISRSSGQSERQDEKRGPIRTRARKIRVNQSSKIQDSGQLGREDAKRASMRTRQYSTQGSTRERSIRTRGNKTRANQNKREQIRGQSERGYKTGANQIESI